MEIPEMGEIVYRQVTVDGKKVGMRLKLEGVTKFDERGNQIHSKDSDDHEHWYEIEYYENDKRRIMLHYEES